MSDPTAQAGSTLAQSKSVEGNVKSKFMQGQAAQAKAAKFNKGLAKHLFLFFLLGLVMGCSVFIPMFSYSIAASGFIYATIALLSFLCGVWSMRRASKAIDWYLGQRFFPKFMVALGVFLALFLGVVLMYLIVGLISSYFEVPPQLYLLFGSAAITSMIPLLVFTSFDFSMRIQPRKYQLWTYPENYVEKQPTWNRERIIFANLHFKRKESESLVTTVKVKLPKEAILGELLYLFIRDYNENRSPDSPIQQLMPRQGTQGWIFRSPNKGAVTFLKKSRILDTDKSVEENKIAEDGHLFFERIMAE